jgi:hypothetical protein
MTIITIISEIFKSIVNVLNKINSLLKFIFLIELNWMSDIFIFERLVFLFCKIFNDIFKLIDEIFLFNKTNSSHIFD